MSGKSELDYRFKHLFFVGGGGAGEKRYYGQEPYVCYYNFRRVRLSEKTFVNCLSNVDVFKFTDKTNDLFKIHNQ